MSVVFSNLPSSKLLNVQPLIDYLENFDDRLYFTLENISSNDMSYRILPNKFITIRKPDKEKLSNVIANLNICCNATDIAYSILNVIKHNKDLLVVSEIISHGISYYDASEKIKSAIKRVEDFLLKGPPSFTISEFKSNIIQIPLTDLKLENIISLILNNGNKILIFIPTEDGRSVISCFLLVTLLHAQNSLLINQIIFLLSNENEIKADSIICSKSWLKQNKSTLSIPKNLFLEFDDKYSSFLICHDCDLFSAVLNYLNSFGNWFNRTEQSNFCLIQENVYDRFLSLLSPQIEKSNQLHLLDCNRQLSLNYVSDIDAVLRLSNSDSISEFLSPIDPSGFESHFFAPFIVKNIVSQHDILINKSLNRFCSFLYTFRSCDEAIAIANRICRHKARIYLWSESVSQCLTMKSQLDYDEILINTIDAPLQVASQLQMICSGTTKTTLSTDEDRIDFTPNQINESLQGPRDNPQFDARYRQLIQMIAAIDASKDTVFRGDCAKDLGKYFKDRHWGSNVGTYVTTEDAHIIEERFPLGVVVLYSGDTVVNDDVIRLVLLAWLCGNEVVLICHNDVGECRTWFELGHVKSVRLLQGAVSVGDLARCVAIDSVIWLCSFDRSMLIDGGWESMHWRFLQASVDEIGHGDMVLPFVQKRKTTVIAAGGLGTK